MGKIAIGRLTPGGAGGGLVVRAAFVIAALAAAATPARAQVQDTLRADTLRADSLVAEQDTLLPPPVMVAWPRPDSTAGGLRDGRWAWDREALLGEGAVSLLDLLSRVPGVVPLRSGIFLQPESVSAFGGGADRMMVVWDGYPLDPLTTASLDLSTIDLASFRRVEVDRRPDVLIVRLYSDAPRDPRAYSRIEAGVGEPRANLFRGMLLSPHFLFGPFGFSVERVEIQGSGRPQPADVFAGWLRWGLLSETRGIELVFRSDNLGRQTESPIPADVSRRDLVVRGRTQFAPAVTAEAYVGRSTVTFDATDPEIPDSLLTHEDESVRQAGARLAWQSGTGGVEGALRWRDSDRLPRTELELDGDISPFAGVRLSAGMTHHGWESGFGATSYHGRASATPLSWMRAFAEFGSGVRGSPSRVDSIITPHKSDRTVSRGGLEASIGRMVATVAGVRMSVDSVPVMGLPGDTITGAVGGGTLNGWELSASMPLAGDWLSLNGNWAAWSSGQRSIYVPSSIGRATVRLHTSPLESGNFELTARLEALHRGPLFGPPSEPDGPLVEAPARTLLNAYLQMRIIDVRIWIRFDDMGGNDVQDLPGLFIKGPRIFYGVKWDFWN